MKYFKCSLCMFMCLGLFVFSSVRLGTAEVMLGGGMEYFTLKTLVDDKNGQYYHSVLQTTLATMQCSYAQDLWVLRLSAALSDWNVSGEWQGTGFGPLSIDPFYWAWQWKYAVELDYALWNPFSLGIQYSDHDIEHYDGLTHFTFLQYRSYAWGLILNWQALKTNDVAFQISVLYAPYAAVNFYQTVYFSQDDISLCQYDVAGKGAYWQSRIRMEYRDSAGWGLDIVYQFGWLQTGALAEISRLTVKSGSLFGFFLLKF